MRVLILAGAWGLAVLVFGIMIGGEFRFQLPASPWWTDPALLVKASEVTRNFGLIFGGAVGISLGVWRVRVADRQQKLNADRQITETFSHSVDQLGNLASTAVRVGAIYALERVAKSSAEDHWQIVETLIAFVRHHAIAPTLSDNAARDTGAAAGDTSGAERTPDEAPEQEVRPDSDVQTALTVIGRREARRESDEQWLDLRQTYLRGADLSGANLASAYFTDADLRGANFAVADLRGANFVAADLSDANFSLADLTGANFSNANLGGADFFEANLDRAIFSGAELSGTDLADATGLTAEQLDEAYCDPDRPPTLPATLAGVTLSPRPEDD